MRGLREGGLVALVVPVAPVAPHVDHHVLAEALAELGGDAADMDYRLDVVAVDVEDRRLRHLGDLGRVARGAGRARVGGEADLVVDHEVNRAPGPVALDVRQPEGLGDDSLPAERRVAVHQEPENLLAFAVAVLALLRAHLADDHGVHRFEMRRVGGERDVDGLAVELAVGRGPEMVLDVARSLHVVGAG